MFLLQAKLVVQMNLPFSNPNFMRKCTSLLLEVNLMFKFLSILCNVIGMIKILSIFLGNDMQHKNSHKKIFKHHDIFFKPEITPTVRKGFTKLNPCMTKSPDPGATCSLRKKNECIK